MSDLALVQGCFGICLGLSELVLGWCRVSLGFIYNSFPAYLRFIPQNYTMQKLMILTTPTKNLRKRSDTNTAETYGVTFKQETPKARKRETQKPRDPETKKPRNQETQKPRNRETKKPRDPKTKEKTETKRPRNRETKKPRNQETPGTESQNHSSLQNERSGCTHEMQTRSNSPGALRNDLWRVEK